MTRRRKTVDTCKLSNLSVICFKNNLPTTRPAFKPDASSCSITLLHLVGSATHSDKVCVRLKVWRHSVVQKLFCCYFQSLLDLFFISRSLICQCTSLKSSWTKAGLSEDGAVPTTAHLFFPLSTQARGEQASVRVLFQTEIWTLQKCWNCSPLISYSARNVLKKRMFRLEDSP